MPHIPLIARHSGSSACGVTPQDAPVLRIIPEHQRGLQTGEASEACHGSTPSAAFDTPCRTGSAHRPEQGSPRYGGDRIASIRIGRSVAAACYDISIILPAD